MNELVWGNHSKKMAVPEVAGATRRVVRWLIPASADSGHPDSLLRESGWPNTFAFSIKLHTEQFPTPIPEPSLL